MEENVILSMRQIVKQYPMGDETQTVLRGIDLDVRKGEFVAVLGPSGSGKSTLMNIIGCLDTPTSGTYTLDGRDVGGLNEDELAQVRSREVGFIFQSFQLLPRQTALENVELPLIYSGVPARERKLRAQQMLERVGLSDKLDHYPSQLSGGQQQRVAIGRALVTHPALIMADEPTGNLDSKNSQEVIALLQSMSQKYQQTILMITHNENQARAADRVFRMADGVLNDLGVALQ